MTVLTEPAHTGEFLMSPSDDMSTRSFDFATIDQNQTLVPGQVLGKVTLGTDTIAAAAAAGNTGNGLASAVTVDQGTPPGVYKAVAISALEWEVFTLNGDLIERAADAVAFSGGGLHFTLTHGGTAFVAGDEFKFTVTAGAAADAAQFKAWDPAATDGSQVVAGLAWEAVTTGAGVTQQTTIVARAAEVNGILIVYPSGQLAAATAGLAALGIIVR